MVTSLVLPAVRRGDISSDRLQAFEAIERRFGWQARIPTVVVALTGFYMTHRLDLWGRFRSGEGLERIDRLANNRVSKVPQWARLGVAVASFRSSAGTTKLTYVGGASFSPRGSSVATSALISSRRARATSSRDQSPRSAGCQFFAAKENAH